MRLLRLRVVFSLGGQKALGMRRSVPRGGLFTFLFSTLLMINIGVFTPVDTWEDVLAWVTGYVKGEVMGGLYTFLIDIMICDSIKYSTMSTYYFGHVGVNASGWRLPAMFFFLPFGRLFGSINNMTIAYVFHAINHSGRRNVLQRVLQSYMLIGITGIIGHATGDVGGDDTASGNVIPIDRLEGIYRLRSIIRGFALVVGGRD